MRRLDAALAGILSDVTDPFLLYLKSGVKPRHSKPPMPPKSTVGIGGLDMIRLRRSQQVPFFLVCFLEGGID